jgi:5'-3' exonuclease
MANQSVSTKSEPVGGVVGFLQYLDMLVYRFSPAKVIVCWESGGSSPRRKKICPTYKENRSKIKPVNENSNMSDLLKDDIQNKTEQLSMLYNILKHTPVCQIFIKDTECDDIIGYLTKYAFVNENRQKIVVSNDKDFYQLLEDKSVLIYDPARKVTLDHSYVKEKFGISARNFCLARTLCGDPSDNIEGVPGIGLKTVSKRFPAFLDEDRDLSIDDVLNDAKSLLETKSGAKLKAPADIIQSEDIIRRNWKLMYLSSANFSASQIEKINGALEMHEPIMDQIGLIKEMLKHGINISFDINNFSTHMKQNLLFD